MPTLPGRILSQARLGDFWEYIFRHLNFYRIHLLFL